MDEPRTLPFRPGDLSWKIMREPILALGSAPTLLLQVTHPLVAAGVRDHSDFRSDPFRRLWRTADIMLKLSFGTPEVSARQSTILRRMHERVGGTSDEGVPYHAMDPDLLTWVWATLVQNGADLYGRIFGALSPGELERFYREQKLVAYACGVPQGHCPETYADFTAYFDRVVRQELRSTDVARIVIETGQRLRVPWPLGPASHHLSMLVAGALLPAKLRGELGIPWNASRARAFAAVIAANRVAARAVPTRLRQWSTGYLVARERPLKLFTAAARR
ncbi:oxygenase MpaB family protein [Planobispora siamensis]|uniref:ER-bound oxygenase mpaB/mpaB'/Rubber oxygenase catalytic domain-containing protein n=1 Tax=Planobispora siamensis TaxID=936338 RepID=A0A8J3SBM8_9ACTN|nr:oxygenase MpaB family protein [Planobispora siamensis]GIH91706.1 hypothetical protein Psi01_23360 [Planobispora siamensis]